VVSLPSGYSEVVGQLAAPTLDHVWANEDGAKLLDGTNNVTERAIGWWIKERYRTMCTYKRPQSVSHAQLTRRNSILSLHLDFGDHRCGWAFASQGSGALRCDYRGGGGKRQVDIKSNLWHHIIPKGARCREIALACQSATT
jgi:hypothetical protein